VKEMIKRWPEPVRYGLSLLATCLIFYTLITAVSFCVSFLHEDGSYVYDEQTEAVDEWQDHIRPK
jgi:hypothetical protein